MGPEAMARESDLCAPRTGGASQVKGAALARGAADVLCLVASPVFALLGILALPGGEEAMRALSGHGESPLGSMALMYLLMSAAHAGAWLRLLSGERPGR